MTLPATCTRFYFLRHGQTDWNAEKRVMGNMPIPLNTKGLTQAEGAAQRLQQEPIQALISSPVLRAWQTSEVIGRTCNLQPIPHVALSEHHNGSWHGQLFAEICSAQGLPEDGSQFPKIAHDAEPFTFTDRRTLDALVHIAEIYQNDFLIVAHAGNFHAITAKLTGHPQHSDNAVPYIFKCHQGIWQVKPL